MGHTYGDHTDCDPDECFTAKARYWRANGGLSVRIPKDWKGPSLQRRAQETVEGARANGLDPVNVGNRWI